MDRASKKYEHSSGDTPTNDIVARELPGSRSQRKEIVVDLRFVVFSLPLSALSRFSTVGPRLLKANSLPPSSCLEVRDDASRLLFEDLVPPPHGDPSVYCSILTLPRLTRSMDSEPIE